MKLRPVRAGEAYQLAYFRSADPPAHVAEVEGWVAGSGWSWFRDDEHNSEERQLLCFTDDDGIGGVVAHHQHGPGMRYLMVVLLDADERGKGRGRELWAAAIENASENGDNVFWMVHQDNGIGLKLSDSFGNRAEVTEAASDYIQYLYIPRDE